MEGRRDQRDEQYRRDGTDGGREGERVRRGGRQSKNVQSYHYVKVNFAQLVGLIYNN